MPEPILFYDIPGNSAPQKAWSPNTWKTRYCLNIKGLPYKTIWVEYPDIEAVCRKIGASAAQQRADGSPYYTLPVIYDPNTKSAVTESAVIARYLDKTYPDTPRLIPYATDALHAAFNHALRGLLLGDVAKIMIPETAKCLPPRSEVYFRTTREVFFNSKLEDISPPGPKRDQYMGGVNKALHTLTQWLEADGTGKLFFLGGKIGFADVSVAGLLLWIRIILGADSKEWAEIKALDGGRWGRFMEALKKYEEVDVGEDAVV
ncbi:glutathione transferase FuA class [Trametes sanguinea]|nr:glutathione transferase FuA class [Trametes sanguinea]